MPRLDGASRSTGGYHGLVDEDKLIVDVTPKIRAVGPEICAFRIVNKHHGETPFEVYDTRSTNISFIHILTHVDPSFFIYQYDKWRDFFS